MKKITADLSLFIVVLTVWGCTLKNDRALEQEIELHGTTFSFDQDTYPSTENLFPQYRIAPGDILDVLFQIQTWREKKDFLIAIDHTVSIKFVNAPELNETQRIQPDGKISLPYLGEVYVIDKTIPALTDYLKQRYSKILRDPVIYVTVPEFRSRIKELKKDLHTAPRGLSRLVMVRPDGYTTFPLVGDVFVAKKPFAELKKILNDMYDDVLPGLHIDLFLEKHAGSIIYILGEIKAPGTYKIMKPISVMEAMAMGGGFLSTANIENVYIFRRADNKLAAVTVNVKKSLHPGNDAKFFYLKPDDIIYIPKSRRATLAEAHREIADILFFRGWSIGFDGTLHNQPILGPEN